MFVALSKFWLFSFSWGNLKRRTKKIFFSRYYMQLKYVRLSPRMFSETAPVWSVWFIIVCACLWSDCFSLSQNISGCISLSWTGGQAHIRLFNLVRQLWSALIWRKFHFEMALTDFRCVLTLSSVTVTKQTRSEDLGVLNVFAFW